MAKNPCIDLMVTAAEGVLNKHDLGIIVRKMEELSAIIQRKNGDGTEEALKKVNRYLQKQATIEALQAKRNAMLNLSKVAKVEKFLDEAFAAGEFREDALSTYLLGSQYFINGENKVIATRLGVDQQQRVLAGVYMNELGARLEKAGLLKLYQKGEFSEEIFLELGNMTTKIDPVAELRASGKRLSVEALEAAEKQGISYTRNTKSSTGIQQAKQVADIIHDLRQEMIERHNLAGGLNDPHASRALHQTHNVHRILRAAKGDTERAYALWREEVMPRIDIEKTFDDVPDIEVALREKFNQIIAQDKRADVNPVKVGDDGKPVQGRSSDPTYFIRKGSLAKRGSKADLVVFKSAADEWAYNQKYGSMSLNDAISSEIMYYGHSTALMENLGPDPEGTFTAIMSSIGRKNIKDGVNVNARSIKKIEPKTAFDQVMGYLDNPATPNGRKVASIARWLKLHQAVSKLGYITVSAIADKPIMHFTLTYNGLSQAEAFLANMKVFLPKTKDERAFISSIGVAYDFIAGEMNSRWSFGGGDIRAGVAHKLQEGMFKVVGMHAWNDAHKGGVAVALMHKLSHYVDGDFAHLPRDIQDRFGQYGINERDWKLLRSAATKGEDGRMYILPENIRKLSIDDIRGVEKSLLAEGTKTNDIIRHRNELETKFRTWIIDQANDAVITPGARERIYARMGAKKGTAAGELIGLLNYFRSFPISVTSKVMGRELHGFEGQISRRMMRATGFLASSAMMGWVSGAVRDILNGKTPKTDWVNEDGSPNLGLMMDSLARGGGIGAYTDVLLYEYDNAYRSLAKTAIGPVFGTIADAVTLANRTVVGAANKDQNVPKPHEYLSFAKANTPFANLPVIKLALDYMLFYRINEALEPGYLRKMERGLENRTGQEFWAGDPSDLY
jgi:hypothetical protein